MAEEGEHPNTKEPMNTQELLNTMVASQIQLREDMNRIMQQFQNLKSNQEGDKADHDPPTLDKFDGTGCLKFYLKMYMRTMQPLGATEEVLA